MDALIIMLGCLASFGLGAYVRQPFCFARKQRPDGMAQQRKDKLAEEWNNLLNYSGKEQTNTDGD